MNRTRVALVGAAVLAMLVLVASATAQATGWQGTWSTNWGPLTLSGSGTLSGPFGYSDSYNEPLGHITNASVSASGDTLTGTWAHDPPSRFAPRDHGTFTVTLKAGAGGSVSFAGTATYAADNTKADFFGTCKSGECAKAAAVVTKDTTPPTVTALAASGKAGASISLRYRVADNSGKARELVRVYRGSTLIWPVKTNWHSTASGMFQIPYTIPRGAKALRFSVQAIDAAGNVSRTSYASITVK